MPAGREKPSHTARLACWPRVYVGDLHACRAPEPGQRRFQRMSVVVHCIVRPFNASRSSPIASRPVLTQVGRPRLRLARNKRDSVRPTAVQTEKVRGLDRGQGVIFGKGWCRCRAQGVVFGKGWCRCRAQGVVFGNEWCRYVRQLGSAEGRSNVLSHRLLPLTHRWSEWRSGTSECLSSTPGTRFFDSP